MSLPRFLNLSKFPEGGIILVIIVLGLLLSVFGGNVDRPQIVNGQRVMHTVDGQHQPVYVKVNKFFNPDTLTQIAKDTSFFAIMAVGMTFVIITAGIDLSVGAIYALAAVSGALFMNQFGSDGPWWAWLVGLPSGGSGLSAWGSGPPSPRRSP
jgi:ribose transport system permease protein